MSLSDYHFGREERGLHMHYEFNGTSRTLGRYADPQSLLHNPAK